MVTLLKKVSVVTLLSLLIATIGMAQSPPRHERKGAWVGVGFGWAVNNLACEGCNFTGPEDPWHGGAGGGAYYAAGGAVNQKLLLGVELSPSGTGDTKSRRSAVLFQLLLVAQYYPNPLGGFHLKAGGGAVSYLLEGPNRGFGGGVQAGGFALQAGIGHDFRIWRGLAVTPYASISATSVSQGSISVSGSGGPVTGLTNRFIAQFGVGVRWY